MIHRRITTIGQVGISRSIRCPALEHCAAICVRAGQIALMPTDAPVPYGFLLYGVRKFDQYNRITLAPEVMADSGISGSVEIIPQGDGSLLLLPAADHTCMVCGVDRNLCRVRGRYICETCIKTAQRQKKEGI